MNNYFFLSWWVPVKAEDFLKNEMKTGLSHLGDIEIN